MEFDEADVSTIQDFIKKPRVEEKVETPKNVSPLPTKEYHVVDPETGQVVGTIDAPLAFCNPMGCAASAGKRNPMGFINPLDKRKERRDLWVHQHCLRPTLAWWDGMWHRLVVDVEGVKLPWQQ